MSAAAVSGLMHWNAHASRRLCTLGVKHAQRSSCGNVVGVVLCVLCSSSVQEVPIRLSSVRWLFAFRDRFICFL